MEDYAPPAEVLDIVDFWFAQPWPLPADEVKLLGVEQFGWTTYQENGKTYVRNSVSGLSVSGVVVVGTDTETSSISFRACDVVPDGSRTGEAELGDYFTTLVREAEARLGPASFERSGDRESASWLTDSRGRLDIRRNRRSISVSYATPQSVELDREAARLGL
ncbi:DUF6301 family protein [Microbacterium sp. BWT-B31]|uniref:DUF6301 family protein n=1 Tax=Microbacterium sp. BWT-B31 TaxID=3232072 RepID=UPI0035290498